MAPNAFDAANTVTALSRRLLLGLILAQAAHSLEEYYFRLYDVLAPARWVSALFSSNLRVGFAVANALLVFVGLCCYLASLRTSEPSGRLWAWPWAVIEAINGIDHLVFAASVGGYFPGLFTAPVLLGVSIALATSLRRAAADERQ